MAGFQFPEGMKVLLKYPQGLWEADYAASFDSYSGICVVENGA